MAKIVEIDFVKTLNKITREVYTHTRVVYASGVVRTYTDLTPQTVLKWADTHFFYNTRIKYFDDSFVFTRLTRKYKYEV